MRPTSVISIIMVLVLLTGCTKQNSNMTVEQEKVAVTTMVADYGALLVSKTYSGTIRGIEQADLIAKLAETVEAVNVSEGDKVKAGDELLRLDEGGPSSQYHQYQALYNNAKKLLAKYDNLYKEGAVSENALDGVRTDFKVAEANYRSARELVYVPAPISGEVTFLNVNVGDQVYVGQQLATVGRRDSVRIKVGIDPEDIDYIEVGDTVTIAMQGDNVNTVFGRITEIARSADPETRAFSVEVVASNEQGMLKVGSLGMVRISLYTVENALLVPIEAVSIQKGIPKLYKLSGDTARSVEVSLGESDGKNYQILDGVAKGDQVIVLGKAFVTDGSLVRLVGGEGAAE